MNRVIVEKIFLVFFSISVAYLPGQTIQDSTNNGFYSDEELKVILSDIRNEIINLNIKLSLQKLERLKDKINKSSIYYQEWLYLTGAAAHKLVDPHKSLLHYTELSKINGKYKLKAMFQIMILNFTLGNYQEVEEMLIVIENDYKNYEYQKFIGRLKIQLSNKLKGPEKAYEIADTEIGKCENKDCEAYLNFHIAHIAILNEDYKIANDYYLKTLPIWTGENLRHSLINLTYVNNQFDLDAARMYSDSVFAILANNNTDSFHVNKGVPYQNLAEYHAFKGNFEKAKELIDLAIYNYFLGPSLSGTPTNYEIDLNINKDHISILDFLDVKMRIYRLSESEELGDIYFYFDQVFQHMILDKFEDDNKFIQISTYYEVYMEAFHYFIAKKQYYNAYAFVQKLKDVVLLDKIKSFDYDNEIPIKYKQQYLNLKDSLQILKALASDEINDMKKRSDIRLDIIQLKAEIQKTHPEYFREKFDGEEISLVDLQSILTHNHGILDYFIEDSLLHIFEINKDDLKYHSYSIDSAFFSLVTECKTFISNKPSLFEFNHQLYKDGLSKLAKLKSIVLPDFIDKYTKLTVVPNGGLNTFPFGALVDDIDRECPFIICSKFFHYVSSSKLLLHTMRSKINEENRMVIIAPHGEDSSDPLFLPGAEMEVKQIEKSFNAENLNFSSKSDLIAKLGSYNIHHFLSHAFINMDNPKQSYISLGEKGDKLPLYEIVRRKLPSKMVNLSACNTGQGQYIEGEGVLSLSRAFLESGAKSIVNTTHAVPDLSSSQIMQSFYQNLSMNDEKSKALAFAKRDFLKGKPVHQQHPYYWSGCIIQGDDSAISSKRSWNLSSKTLLFSGILLLGVGFYKLRHILSK